MKYFIFLSVIILYTSSCVQPAYEQKVTFILDVSDIPSVRSCGIRGAEKPLSWNKDLTLTPIIKDSLYTAEVKFVSGMLYTEVKFVVNDTFELNDLDNRRIQYDVDRNTTYNCKFNQAK
jgi:putative oxidoreductase